MKDDHDGEITLSSKSSTNASGCEFVRTRVPPPAHTPVVGTPPLEAPPLEELELELPPLDDPGRPELDPEPTPLDDPDAPDEPDEPDEPELPPDEPEGGPASSPPPASGALPSSDMNENEDETAAASSLPFSVDSSDG